MSRRENGTTSLRLPHAIVSRPFVSNAIDPSEPYTRDSASPRSSERVSHECARVPTAPFSYSATTTVVRSGPAPAKPGRCARAPAGRLPPLRGLALLEPQLTDRPRVDDRPQCARQRLVA